MRNRFALVPARSAPRLCSRALVAIIITPWLLQGCGKEDDSTGADEPQVEQRSQQIQQADGTYAQILRTDDGVEYVEGELLVRFHKGTSEVFAASVHSQVGAQVMHTYISQPELQLVSVPEKSLKDALSTYLADPRVAHAELNLVYRTQVIPNDPRFGELWGLHNTGQAGGVEDADINAPEAWELTQGIDNGTVMVVIDTGVDYTHPDLADNMWVNPGEIPGNGIDDDGNGYIDDVHGINAITNSGNPMDDNGHGSHVAGTIAAKGDNAEGVVGVNWHGQIMGCKFLDAGGSGSLANAVKCMEYVHMMRTRETDQVNIIGSNNSWGGGGFSQELLDGIVSHHDAGVLFIAAAGNSSANNDTATAYPANYFVPNVLSVAAHDRADTLAWFSSYGRRTVHVSAPGVDVLSTVPGNGYSSFSGTSMATPHVAGLVSLLSAQDPSRDWLQLRNLVLTGGVEAAHAVNTLTGKRIRAADVGGQGSLTCNDQVLNTRIRPIGSTISASMYEPVELIAYNLNCDAPAGNVTVTVEPTGQTVVLADTGRRGDQYAGDGQYTGYYEPQEPGTYTLTFPDGEEVTLNVTSASSYVKTVVPYEWRTITGTNLGLGDDSTAVITSPFEIPFAGGAGVTQMTVGMNGGIRMESTSGLAYVNAALPTAQYATLVAPFWDDLFPGPTADDNVYWAVTGTEPNRELVVEWRDVYHISARSGNTFRFQVVFFEGSPNILFNYQDVMVGNANFDRGASATIGVQVSGSSATQHSLNTPSVDDLTAMLWTIPDPSTAPVAGALQATPAQLSEGDLLTLQTSFTSPDGDDDGPFRVEFDLDYAGWFIPEVVEVVNTQGAVQVSTPMLHSGDDVVVAVRVLNGSGTRSLVETATVSVTDVPPAITSLTAPDTLNERQAATFTAIFTDPGLDAPWRVQWDWNHDGATFNPVQTVTVTQPGAVNVSRTFPQDGTYTIAARVVDKDGVTSNVQSLSVDVADLAPLVAELSSPETHIRESQTVELNSSFGDPGDNSWPWRVQWDWDYDGVTFNVAQEESVTTDGEIRAWRTMPDSGTFTIALRVVDSDGSVSAVRTIEVIVDEVDPVIEDFSARPLSTSENEPRTVAFSVMALSGADIPEMDPIERYLWDFDGDGEFDYLSQTPFAIHTYRDNPAGGDTYTVIVRVEDEDTYADAAVEVVVRNVAPTLSPLAERDILEGELLLVQAQATDPGDDVLTFSLENAPAGMSITADGLISWRPTYTQTSGTGLRHTATVIVTDDDGDSDAQPFAVSAYWLDTDGDGIPDTWEIANGTNPLVADAHEDPNGDGITNLERFLDSIGELEIPEAGVAMSPLNGTRVDSEEIVLVAQNLTNLGTLTSANYQFQVFADAELSDKVRDVTVAETPGSSTSVVITSGTESTELENLEDNEHYTWRVRVTDGTLRGPWSAAQRVQYNPVNDAPGAPRAVQPLDGMRVMELHPMLIVDNAVDPDDHELSYRFEIASNAGLTENLQTSGAVPGDARGSTSWVVPVALDPSRTYYWRATAMDPQGAEAASVVSSFTIYIGQPGGTVPVAPALEWPTSDVVVDTATPTLQAAGESIGVDGKELSYIFEVDTSPSFGSAARQVSPGQAAVSGRVEWTTAPLREDTRYYWRVRAHNGTSASDWTVASFVVNEQNDAPSAPVALNPTESMVSTQVPTLMVQNVVDPEGDTVTYSFVVRKQGESDPVETVQGVAEGANGVTSYTMTVRLDEGAEYVWQAQAVDEHGASSELSAEAVFNVFRHGSDPGGCSAAPAGRGAGGLLPLLALGLGLGLLSRRRRQTS